jgi:hypothetical protein
MVRIKKGQLVSFRPKPPVLRRDATVRKKIKTGQFGTLYEISVYASPSELSTRRSFEWAQGKLKEAM